MTYLQCALIVVISAAIGCAAPQADSRGAQPAAGPSEAANAPTPAVSHAADTAPLDRPSTTTHHADRPSDGPAVDAEKPAPPAVLADAPAAPPPAARAVTIPAGTTLNLRLTTSVSSNGSRVEDAVQATVARAIAVNGRTVVPAGARVSGYVSEAAESGRVKGRARVAVRFSTLRVGGARYDIRTAAVTRQAPGTKKADAAKVGIGAGAGAIVGGIAGGKKGAAVGTAVGAAGGTGVVLATRGEDVTLPRGSVVTARLSRPVTIRLN